MFIYSIVVRNLICNCGVYIKNGDDNQPSYILRKRLGGHKSQWKENRKGNN